MLVVYLTLFLFIFVCIYVCKLVVSLTLPFKYLFFQLAAWQFKLLGYFGQPAPLSSVVSIYYVYCSNHGVK